jgi:membrane-associated protease RseP (regulator of RpoE activity)
VLFDDQFQLPCHGTSARAVLPPRLRWVENSTAAAWLVGAAFTQVNLVLMFFNLIPIPPLDGSSVLPLFLSNRQHADGTLVDMQTGRPWRPP